jgi:ubiquitin-protein ligase
MAQEVGKLLPRAVKRIQRELLEFGGIVEKKSNEQIDRKDRHKLLAEKFGGSIKEEPKKEPKKDEPKKEEQTIMLCCPNDDLSKLEALVIGPPDTPYQGAFMYIKINLPSNYPFAVPKFKFCTPEVEPCYMHPNMYSNGKICLSIINTWASNEWNAGATLENVLVTIQSRLTCNPIIYEPSFEMVDPTSIEATTYELVATYKAFDVGVLKFLTRKDVPAEIMTFAREYFMRHLDMYERTLQKIRCKSYDKYQSMHDTVTISKKTCDELSRGFRECKAMCSSQS